MTRCRHRYCAAHGNGDTCVHTYGSSIHIRPRGDQGGSNIDVTLVSSSVQRSHPVVLHSLQESRIQKCTRRTHKHNDFTVETTAKTTHLQHSHTAMCILQGVVYIINTPWYRLPCSFLVMLYGLMLSSNVGLYCGTHEHLHENTCFDVGKH